MNKLAEETKTKTTTAKLNGKSIKLDYEVEQQPDQVIRTVIPFQMKSLNDEERSIEFIGSTATVDRYGDTIIQAGWEIGNFTKNPVVPWGHKYEQPPVAKAVEVGLRDGNLFFKARFPSVEELCPDPTRPSEWALFIETIYNLYKGGYLRAFSVGFIPLEYEGNWEDGYVFTKCELLEVSCVTVPANPEALVLAFREGVISERQKSIMVKQAQTLIKSLTEPEESKINEDMSEDTKAYIDEQITKVLDAVAGLKSTDVVEEPAEEADETADSSDDGTGEGTEDAADADEIRSVVRAAINDRLGKIE